MFRQLFSFISYLFKTLFEVKVANTKYTKQSPHIPSQ